MIVFFFTYHDFPFIIVYIIIFFINYLNLVAEKYLLLN